LSQREKRREKRLDEENKVVLRLISDKGGQDEVYYAFSEDISPGGIKVITDTPFSVKTRFEVEMPLPKEKRIIRGVAEVRWVKSRPEGEIYEMGLEFVELDQQNKIHLLEHVYRKIMSS
jgi:uncharacterized protein (TIGR02266 family)